VSPHRLKQDSVNEFLAGRIARGNFDAAEVLVVSLETARAQNAVPGGRVDGADYSACRDPYVEDPCEAGIGRANILDDDAPGAAFFHPIPRVLAGTPAANAPGRVESQALWGD